MIVGLNGFGQVAKALIRHWQAVQPDLVIAFIRRKQSQWINLHHTPVSQLMLSELEFQNKTDLYVLLGDCKIDTWFELTPTDLDQAKLVHAELTQILARSINVVCANKAPIVYDYVGLKQVADKQEVRIGLSGVMGATLPVQAIAKLGISGAKVLSMKGILNSTSNFMLEKMERGISFAKALSEAQAEGIAEPNWHYDVAGFDSGFKMAIIASVLLNKNISLTSDNLQGIDRLSEADLKAASRNTQRYKLIACYQAGAVTVSPELVPADELFFQVNGSDKVLSIETDCLGEISLLAKDSGLEGVAAALHRDLLNVSI